AAAMRPESFGPPRLVTAADPALRVLRGYIDLFLVEVGDGGPSGMRHHVMRVGVDGVVLGTAPVAAETARSFGLLAVAGLDCAVEAMAIERLLVSGDAASLVDGWMIGLGAAASSYAEAGRLTLARPGETLELANGTMIRAAPRSVAWLAVAQGRVTSEIIVDP